MEVFLTVLVVEPAPSMPYRRDYPRRARNPWLLKTRRTKRTASTVRYWKATERALKSFSLTRLSYQDRWQDVLLPDELSPT